MGDVTLSRRQFLRCSLTLVGLSLLAGCGFKLTLGSAAPKVRKIGFLGEHPSAQSSAFREGLRELGYVEDQTISIEYRSSQGNNDQVPALIADLLRHDVECIVTSGITESVLAKPANTAIPMIAVLQNFDAIESGLVTNIARPEGNITGIAGISGLRLQSKLPEIIKETLPDTARVAVLAYARQPSVDVVIDGVKDAARQLGLQLEITMLQEPGGIESAVAAISGAGARVLMIIHGNVFSLARAQLAALTLGHRLATFTPDTELPKAGGLIAYSVNRTDGFRRAATYVDKILKGSKPADLPMERPTKFDFVINLKTAQSLGLTIPPSVLQQATDLIQ
jgi:putative tryptophan/tyrosine transport system substrate-binding protein